MIKQRDRETEMLGDRVLFSAFLYYSAVDLKKRKDWIKQRDRETEMLGDRVLFSAFLRLIKKKEKIV